MKDTFVSARLVEKDLIRLVIFSSIPFEKLEAKLVIDRTRDVKLLASKVTSTTSTMIADFRLNESLELGHSYALAIPSYPVIPLDVSEATNFEDFDANYSYFGDDLGCSYEKSETTFVVFAPLASTVTLKIKRPQDELFSYFMMKREEKGIFRIALKGDYERANYLYLVTNNEITAEATDPYAKASAPNGEYSVVADFSKFPDNPHSECLPHLGGITDAFIYEGSVRDLTIDRHSDIEHKGTYSGLVEEGRKTTGGNPAGFDYLKSLGISHLQILPFYDFKTVDERHPEKSYNWGYDPSQYFVPEGSYSADVEDPYKRILEVKELVSKFHSAGIRIVMDVVFNHVYEYLSSAFEKLVPNYYFRRRSNGRMANTSYCGDDVMSERPMMRKLIVDACKWWIDFYHIDGFRFDLMGIIDVITLEQIAAYARKKDPSFLLYGEGWNMGGEASVPLGHVENKKLIPEYSFFNDKFREAAKRYIGGDYFLEKEHFKYSILGSCLDYGEDKARFENAERSLNYVECHDNATYYDFLSSSLTNSSPGDKLDLVKLSLAAVLFSFGVPFIHAGEEIAQSKFGKDNTYNLPDVYNKFSYRLLDERIDLSNYFKSLIGFRKKNKFLRHYDPRSIAPLVNFIDLENGALLVRYKDGNELAEFSEMDFFFNPGASSLTYNYSSDRILLIDASGDVGKAITKVQSLLVPRRSFIATGLVKGSGSERK